MATDPTSGPTDREYAMVALGHIQVHPLNLRRELRGLDELADSIRQNGLLEPVLLVPAAGDGEEQYVLIAGHRRYEACRMAGHDPIEALIRHDLTSDGAQVIAMLTENGPRDDLTPIEQAHGYQLALDLNHLTPSKLARRLGKPKAAIASRIALTRLPDHVQDRVHAHQISLQEAETLVEFAGDASSLDALLPHVGSQSFNYHAEVLRRGREVARRIAEVRRELQKAGLKVIDRPVEYGWRSIERSVSDFVDPAAEAREDGLPVRFTADGHAAACGFHAAFINSSTFEPEHVCSNPEEAGHTRAVIPPRPMPAAGSSAQAGGPVISAQADAGSHVDEDQQRRLRVEAEQAEARRREDLEVAARVRRTFLSTLVQRTGKAHLQAVLELLLAEHFQTWLDQAEWEDVEQLAGVIDARLPAEPDRTWGAVTESLRAGLDSRRSPDAMGGALLAIAAHNHEWSLAAGDGWEDPGCRRYLDWLIGRGYEPTEVERELLRRGEDASA